MTTKGSSSITARFKASDFRQIPGPDVDVAASAPANDAPIYTRPADYKGWKVPEILLSGNEAKIKDWEMEQSYERTKRLRPDLLKR